MPEPVVTPNQDLLSQLLRETRVPDTSILARNLVLLRKALVPEDLCRETTRTSPCREPEIDLRKILLPLHHGENDGRIRLAVEQTLREIAANNERLLPPPAALREAEERLQGGGCIHLEKQRSALVARYEIEIDSALSRAKITIPAGTSIKHFVETVVPLVRSIYGLPVITQNLKDVLLERNPQFDEIRSSEHVIKVAGLASDSTRANIRAHLPKGYDLTRLVMSHDAVAIHAACLLVRGCDFFQGQMVLLQNGSMFYDFNLSGPDEKRGLSKEGHIADMCTALCYTNETQ